MAKPRVFISSTYFDLKSLREDLDRFITSLGYEPVRHEQGHIAYGKDEAPEAFAYKEIEYCDILVSIIGSRIGTQAAESDYSISQKELKRAVEIGKPVFVFVEASVLAEFRFFQANKAVPDIVLSAVDDKRIYAFIEEIAALPKGNPMFPFSTGGDIITTLRTQWAGLFQRELVSGSKQKEDEKLDKLQRGLQTVDELVRFLQEDKAKNQAAFQDILFSNHPMFSALREATKNKYRLYFSNFNELEEWLKGARSYERAAPFDPNDEYVWVRKVAGLRSRPPTYSVVRVAKSLFDEQGNLKPMQPGQWNDSLLLVEKLDDKPDFYDDSDDIPF